MDKVASALLIRQPEDWKRVTIADIKARGGAGLLKLYGDSLLKTLQSVYPEQALPAYVCRERMPHGYWNTQEHRRSFMDKLRETMGLLLSDDWYLQITANDVKHHGGTGLLRAFGGNLRRIVADAYPELELPVRERKPPGYWERRRNRKACLEEVALQLGIQDAKGWAGVTVKKVIELGGNGVLKYHSYSLLRALEEAYPDMTAELHTCIGTRRKGYWDDKNNRRAFLDEYARQRGMGSREDWKRASWRDIIAAGGAGVLSKYTSIQVALEDVYGGEWLAHECRGRVPRHFWETEANVRSFLDYVKRELRIRNEDDWYRVSVQQLSCLNGAGLLARMPLRDALEQAYGMEWDASKLLEGMRKRSSQRLLVGHMNDIFGATRRQELSQ